MEQDFHNFYKYELDPDDSDCMSFLLSDYIGNDFKNNFDKKRIQDFVFLLLHFGLTENQTLNILIESLYYLPRRDILFECSISDEDFKFYKFGKFICIKRLLIFKLYNDFEEKEFKTFLKMLVTKYKFCERQGEELGNLWNILNNLVCFINEPKNLKCIMNDFKNFGNKAARDIIADYKTCPESVEQSEQLWTNVQNSQNKVEDIKIPLALEKGNDAGNPSFVCSKNGKVAIIPYRENLHYPYPENDSEKSMCLIFAIQKYDTDTRKGSEVDIESIRKEFRKLHFTVNVYRDHTKEEMFNTAKTFSELLAERAGSMLVCFILAHGAKNCILDVNRTEVNIREFSLMFSAKNCPAYFNKPKLFFIQACQGDSYHEGISSQLSDYNQQSEQYTTLEVEQNNSRPKMREYTKFDIIPEEADYFVGMSTVPDYVAYRSTKYGSWYISSLCKELSKEVKTKDVVNILTSVNYEISRKKLVQMPSVYFTLRKKCFLTKPPEKPHKT